MAAKKKKTGKITKAAREAKAAIARRMAKLHKTYFRG